MGEISEKEHSEPLVEMALINPRVKFNEKQAKILRELFLTESLVRDDLKRCADYFSSGREEESIYGDVLLEALRAKIDSLEG